MFLQDNDFISFGCMFTSRNNSSVLKFLRSLHTVFHNTVSINISTNSVQGFAFFQPSPTPIISFCVVNVSNMSSEEDSEE